MNRARRSLCAPLSRWRHPSSAAFRIHFSSRNRTLSQNRDVNVAMLRRCAGSSRNAVRLPSGTRFSLAGIPGDVRRDLRFLSKIPRKSERRHLSGVENSTARFARAGEARQCPAVSGGRTSSASHARIALLSPLLSLPYLRSSLIHFPQML